jgi:hypothetical protein
MSECSAAPCRSSNVVAGSAWIATRDVNVLCMMRGLSADMGIGMPQLPKGSIVRVLETPGVGHSAAACVPRRYWALFPVLVGWRHLWRVLQLARYVIWVPIAVLQTAFIPVGEPGPGK